MSGTVTLPGSGGTSVTIPYSSSAIAAMAQASTAQIMTYISQPSIPGIGPLFTEEVTPVGNATLPIPAAFGQANITTGGNYGLMPTGYLVVDDTATTQVVAVNLTDQATLVYAGSGGLAYGNSSPNNTVYLAAGGNNVIQEEFSNAASTVYVDSSVASWTDTGGGITGIDPLTGSETVYAAGGAGVEVFANTGKNVVFVNQNVVAGDVNLVAISNADTISGTTTTAVTVNAFTAGALVDIAAFGGPAVINPGAANILVLAGGSGSETLNAGTGSATVSSGPSGIFYGGSAGNNVLETSTIAGSTTLFGGGSGDQLFAFASGSVLNAGIGNEEFATNSAASVSGVQFNLGGESSTSVDTVFGSAGGADTIGLGSGANDINLFGSAAHTVSIAAAAGTDTLSGFTPGTDIFKLGGLTVSSDVYAGAGGNTTVVLSDGTHLTFVGVNMQTSNFS